MSTFVKFRSGTLIVVLVLFLLYLSFHSHFSEHIFYSGMKLDLKYYSQLGNKTPFTAEVKVENFVRSFFPIEEQLKTKMSVNYSVAVITYVSESYSSRGMRFSYSFLFGSTLFASWKQALKRLKSFKKSVEPVKVDLMVYCPVSVCHKLPFECVPLDSRSRHMTSKFHDSSCLYRQATETKHPYGYINSFAYLQDSELPQLVNNYDYILRTDPDTFLTLSFFTWRVTTPLVVGFGGYSHQFNFEMLDKIARELGMGRQKLWNVGSSWYVRSDLFWELSRNALYATLFIYYDGFNRFKRPEIEMFYVSKNNWKWPEWYQYVATMYGSDLAVQNLTSHFSLNESQVRPFGALDFEAHSPVGMSSVTHIHPYNSFIRHFSKYQFLYDAATFCVNGTVGLTYYAYFKDYGMVSKLSYNAPVRDFCHAIATRGTLDYLIQHGCFQSVEQNAEW